MPPLAPSPRARCRGVTLVEIVIAIFILTIGVLSIISLFPSGIRLSKRAFDTSVAALATRDALARITADSNSNRFTFPDPTDTDEDNFYDITEANRVGTIYAINSATQVQCKVRGNKDPEDWTGLGDYYLVITSGTARGFVCKIASNGANTITVEGSNVFRYQDSTKGQPVRVGDHFALIGSKTGSKCFPTNSTKSIIRSVEVTHKSFLEAYVAGQPRTIPTAHEGEDNLNKQDQWDYSYGCIVSTPSREWRHVCRVDVFVYRGFNQGKLELRDQFRPVGHFVTYIPNVADYDHVDELDDQ